MLTVNGQISLLNMFENTINITETTTGPVQSKANTTMKKTRIHKTSPWSLSL